jgi:hypothetical protein
MHIYIGFFSVFHRLGTEWVESNSNVSGLYLCGAAFDYFQEHLSFLKILHGFS